MHIAFSIRGGTPVPSIGFGTRQILGSCTEVSSAKTAFCCGFRHFDAAPSRHNERCIGSALQAVLAKDAASRKELFVSGKVLYRDACTDLPGAYRATLDAMQLDSLDLYLLCAPQPGDPEPDLPARWRAMVALYQSGAVRTIGVCGFSVRQLQMLMSSAVPPMVNQIVCHPGSPQTELVHWCQQQGILVESCTPFGGGSILEDPFLVKTARSYHRTVPQICLRWCLQRGMLPIVHSSLPSHIQTDLDIRSFVLTPTDMLRLDRMNQPGTSGRR